MPPKGSKSEAKSKTTEPDIIDASPGNTLAEAAATNTATPTVRRSKRKAAQEEADGDHLDANAAATISAKKPKVSVHTTEVNIVSSSGKPTQHQTHHNVKLDIPLSSISTTTPKLTTGKRIVFNDDESKDDAVVSPDGPNEFFTPQGSPTTSATPASARQQQPTGNDDDDGNEEDAEVEEDSDDDAPEAVSTHTAAAQAAKSAQAAAHAAGRQREAERQRRQERDARLKAQAKGSSSSRKKKEQLQQPLEESESGPEEAGAENDDDEEEEEEEEGARTKKPTTKRFPKNHLPDLLPEELLASDSESDSDGDDDDKQARRKPTITKFNTVARQVSKQESRKPADQRVGSTVYRVMKKKEDARLAPKGGKQSRNARELLLGRPRPGAAKSRTATARKGGFLVQKRP